MGTSSKAKGKRREKEVRKKGKNKGKGKETFSAGVDKAEAAVVNQLEDLLRKKTGISVAVVAGIALLTPSLVYHSR